MDVRRPVAPEAGRLAVGPAKGGEVVAQGVHPDVEDVARVIRQWDPPAERASRDRQIAYPLAELADDLVAPAVRLEEVRVRLDVLQHSRGVPGQAEEVTRLSVADERPAGDGRAVALLPRLRFGDEFLLAFVVPALVAAEVDVAGGLEAADDLLHGRTVPLLCGADE